MVNFFIYGLLAILITVIVICYMNNKSNKKFKNDDCPSSIQTYTKKKKQKQPYYNINN